MRLFHIKAVIMMTVFIAAPALGAESNVIVLDGKQSSKRQQQKADPKTKVINLKGSASQASAQDRADDICQRLGGQYFCKHKGRTAVDAATGAQLGKITGLAWRDRGQSIGAYLRQDASDSGLSIARNVTAKQEGFYYIIQDDSGLVFMAETARVVPEG